MKSSVLRCLSCWLLVFLASGQVLAQAEEPHVAIIEFSGTITPVNENLFYRHLEQAQAANVDIVVVEIFSPGGFVDSSLNLADALAEVDWATTVAYVPKEALSGAAIMSLGCDQIIMGADARIGDAGPIFQGEDALFRHAPEKIRSDLVARVRRLAEKHDRPPALAEAMVDMDLVVFKMTQRETGEITYKSNPEIDAMEEQERWDKGPPIQESREGLFLELQGDRAAELQFTNAVVGSRKDLADHLGVDEEDFLEFSTSWIDLTVMALNWWPVTGLLLLVGILALYIEMGAPGTGIGGLLAGLCFAIFFWSRFLGGTAGWLEVILFLGGIVFILVEMFVIPGFGFAGVTGGLLILVALLMASQSFSPNDGLAVNEIVRSLFLILGAGVIGLVAMSLLSRRLGTIPIFGRLSLQPPPTSEMTESAAGAIVTTEHDVQTGDRGVADSPLRPAGRALFGDRYVDVVTDGSFIDQGDQIKVIDVSGNRIMVRKV